MFNIRNWNIIEYNVIPKRSRNVFDGYIVPVSDDIMMYNAYKFTF